MKTLASTKALGLALFGLVAGGCSFSFGSGGPYTNTGYGKPVYNNYSYETDARNTRPKPVKKASNDRANDRPNDRADDRAVPPKRTPKAEPPRRTKPSDPPPTRAGTPVRDSDARPLSRDRDARRPTRDPKAEPKKPTREPTRGRTFEPGSDEPARKGEARRPTRSSKSEPARRPAPNRFDPDQSDEGKTKDTTRTRRGRTLGRS